MVGTVTNLAVTDRDELGCDIVEIRLDQIGVATPGWQDACARLEARGLPVILTLRHASEGGAWDGTKDERREILARAMPVVSAIDVEIRQNAVPGLRALADQHSTVLIDSYHDFERTPSDTELDEAVRDGQRQGADIVKIAARTETEEELERLRDLLRRFPDVDLALLGMGTCGPASRVSLPCAGSCLTYGFLDEAVAPGQIAAAELRRQLAAACDRYSFAD